MGECMETRVSGSGEGGEMRTLSLLSSSLPQSAQASGCDRDGLILDVWFQNGSLLAQ